MPTHFGKKNEIFAPLKPFYCPHSLPLWSKPRSVSADVSLGGKFCVPAKEPRLNWSSSWSQPLMWGERREIIVELVLILDQLPLISFPLFLPFFLKILDQRSRPSSWCIFKSREGCNMTLIYWGGGVIFIRLRWSNLLIPSILIFLK